MLAILLAALLIAACWISGHLGLLPSSAVLMLDSLANAFRWIGVTDPAAGWLLLGVLGGALIGAVIGLRRAGRAGTGRHIGRLSVVIAAALLVAGSRRPETAPRTVRQAAELRPAPPTVRHMYVATERASVRAWPGADANVVAELPGRSHLDVLRASSDGAWWYVQGHRGSRTVVGWMRRSALADGVPRTGPDPIAPASTALAQHRPRTDTVGGEVVLSRDSPTARPTAPSDAPSPVLPGTSPHSVETSVSRPRVDSGAAAAVSEREDRSVAADVQARLAEARAAVRAEDYAAALRALTAADESITIASAKFGDAGWLATLRHDAAVTRGATRTACQAAAVRATNRGDAAPRCE